MVNHLGGGSGGAGSGSRTGRWTASPVTELRGGGARAATVASDRSVGDAPGLSRPNLPGMPRDPDPLDTPGLAGGPGPAPPGVDDATPRARSTPPHHPGAADAQREAAEVSEQSAGTRAGEIDDAAGERGPGTDNAGPPGRLEPPDPPA
jgi:hypothetical protein